MVADEKKPWRKGSGDWARMARLFCDQIFLKLKAAGAVPSGYLT